MQLTPQQEYACKLACDRIDYWQVPLEEFLEFAENYLKAKKEYAEKIQKAKENAPKPKPKKAK